MQMGCSSSSVVSSFEAFNADAEGRSGTIVFQDGRKLDVHNILAFPDSTHFLNEGTSAVFVVPTRTIKNVVFTDRGIGFLEGFGFGALAGSLTVLAISAASPAKGGEFSGVDYLLFFMLIGGGAGGVVGGIPGLIIGHSHEFQFVTSEESAGLSPDDTLHVTVDEILAEKATSFIGRIKDREYPFDKAEAAYSWKKTDTGYLITVRGTRGMFRRKGVFIPR
jgi:hypothetical protein